MKRGWIITLIVLFILLLGGGAFLLLRYQRKINDREVELVQNGSVLEESPITLPFSQWPRFAYIHTPQVAPGIHAAPQLVYQDTETLEYICIDMPQPEE